MTKAIKPGVSTVGETAPTALYRMQVRMILRIARWMNRFLEDARVADMIKDAEIIGEDASHSFPRLRAWLTGCWYRRPVICRFSTLDERYERGTIAGLRHDFGEVPFNVIELGAEDVPESDEVHRHGKRTSSGALLVAVR